MARKKKRGPGRPRKDEIYEDEEESFFSITTEAKHSIFAILSFALAGVFVLASFGNAGFVGDKLYAILDFLFGAGFFIVPLVLILAGISFLFSMQKKIFLSTVGGGVLILVSLLGILELFFGEKFGGYVGFFVAGPMNKLFDMWASVIILSAVFVASFVAVLNLSLKINLDKKNEDEEEDGEEYDSDESSKVKEMFSLLKDELSKIKNREHPEKDSGSDEDFSGGEEDEYEEDDESLQEQEDGDITEKVFDPNPAGAGAAIKGKRANPSFAKFSPPPLDLLEDDKGKPLSGDIRANANIIKRTLQNFGISVEMGEVNIGPSITQYTLRPAEGIKLAKITSLQNDLALALAAHPIRVEAPIPGKPLVGIEIPNKAMAMVRLKNMFSLPGFTDSQDPLLLSLGRNVSGNVVYGNLAKMPHLLVAGSTGSGKSVSIHAMMSSLLFRNSPNTLRFILIDPKRVELSVYSGIPHLLTPVITDPKKSISALKWAGKEMERRYDLLQSAGARDIFSYLKTKPSAENSMPFIVIVIDELADLMSAYPREMEAAIVRLAQMSRAVGIHLIVSTQRPSVEVITGLIKANITSRIAFQVASQVDSRTILDMSGAEKLLGSGDMLYMSGDASKPQRIQGAFVSENELRKTTQFIEDEYSEEDASGIDFAENENSGESIFDTIEGEDSSEADELYDKAKEVILETRKASTSFLQRRLYVGYARAARLMDLLEKNGIVGPADGSKPRDVFVGSEEDGFDKDSEEDTPDDNGNNSSGTTLENSF